MKKYILPIALALTLSTSSLAIAAPKTSIAPAQTPSLPEVGVDTQIYPGDDTATSDSAALASAIASFNSSVQAAGRPLNWDLIYISDSITLSPFHAKQLTSIHHFRTITAQYLDALAKEGVHNIVLTLWINDTLENIANGLHDTNLNRLAYEMYSWQKNNPGFNLILRPLHEMNIENHEWSVGYHGNTAAQFSLAWDHMRSVMHKGFPNLPFMFCPGTSPVNQSTAPADFSAYYPGNDEVEYLALDGYNRSKKGSAEWESLEEVFHKSLIGLEALNAKSGVKLPIVLAEVGTPEPSPQAAAAGHSKAEWFYGMGTWLANHASEYGITALIYFDSSDDPANEDYKIYDPSLPTANASRASFQKAVKDWPPTPDADGQKR